MSENQILMTQSQNVRHRNKSPQYIGWLAKAGVLVMRGASGGRRCIRRRAGRQASLRGPRATAGYAR